MWRGQRGSSTLPPIMNTSTSKLSRLRRSQLVHALAVFALVSVSIIAIPSTARADCPTCWPDPPVYYEQLDHKPANWISIGHYREGDWVWQHSENINGQLTYTKWYVVESDDPGWWNQPDPCCAVGPWFVTAQGGLYLVW